MNFNTFVKRAKQEFWENPIYLSDCEKGTPKRQTIMSACKRILKQVTSEKEAAKICLEISKLRFIRVREWKDEFEFPEINSILDFLKFAIFAAADQCLTQDEKIRKEALRRDIELFHIPL